MASEKDEEIQKATIKLMVEEEINAKSSPSNESFAAVDEQEDSEKTGDRRRHHQRQLLSKLLSQIESSEEDNKDAEEPKQDSHVEDALLSSEVDENTTTPKEVASGSHEEIIKELKNLKRQNVITHCLLTAMIVLTLAWQLSEVSLILKIKDGLSNPLGSVGGLIKGFFKKKRPQVNNVQDVMKQASERQKQVIEPTSLPGLNIPEIPHLELPGFDTSDKD